jgi:FtsP/CotA-like multicopper oxidase with cupredoxin domain
MSWNPVGWLAGLVFATSNALLAGPALAAVPSAPGKPPEAVRPNDNLQSAGTLNDGTLTLALRAAAGGWQPEGPAGPTLEIEAFGEIDSALTVPAPLIRVVEGTAIAVSIRNDLHTTLTVHGLCSRDEKGCPALDVPAGETRDIRFAASRAGTYHYWASSIGAPMPFRELAGAFVVDAASGASDPDRIFVITEWTNLTPQQLREIVTADDQSAAFLERRPRLLFAMNGLSWPATERLRYQRGERVRWRVINLSSQTHPMHLHGFYFDVDSLGNGHSDTVFDEAHRRRVVTQLVPSSGTLTMTWLPEREGNWLFHCHVMSHVSPMRRLSDSAGGHDHHSADGPADRPGHRDDLGGTASGMAGMILGITVTAPSNALGDVTGSATPPVARRLTLTIQQRGDTNETRPAGFTLSDGDPASVSGEASAPGPPIVLKRGEPVEITVVNRLAAPTAIHWHGMELDSYYDGVHGWSGIDRRLAPMIEPGRSFVVRLTPTHAGTFIYHTHLHDYLQLSSGLYGPLIVTEADETFDPATDHVIVLGRTDVSSEEPSVLSDPDSVVMNGSRRLRQVWPAGQRHRVRVINITPDDIFAVSLQTINGPATWTPRTKDGAALPAAEVVRGPARQTIAVGETYEFEYEAPRGRSTVWLEVRTTAGKWQAQGEVVIR